MTLDDTIARDLTALAADNRRAWRTADDALARLNVAPAKLAAPRLDALALTAATHVFARRVARIAAGATAMLVISAVVLKAFWQGGEDRVDLASLIDQGWVGTAASLAVPMLLAYVVARQLAARWLATSLSASDSPDELVRRWARFVDSWSTGVVFAAGTWLSLAAGLLYFAFYRSFPFTAWFERFPDGTTRTDRLTLLPVALLAAVLVACSLGRASSHPRAWVARTASRGWWVCGVAALAITVGAGHGLDLWPIAPRAIPTHGGSLFLTLVGTASVMMLVAALASRIRSRDERDLSLGSPQVVGAAGLAVVENALARRFAWIASGVTSVVAMALVTAILNWPDRYSLRGLAQAPFVHADRDWTRSPVTEFLVGDTNTWFRVFVAVVAAHAVGARTGSWIFQRVVARAAHPEQAAKQLLVRLARGSLAAVVAGLTSVVSAFVCLSAISPTNFPYSIDERYPNRITLYGLGLALVAIITMALALGRRGSSGWRWFASHPAALIFGVPLATATAYVMFHPASGQPFGESGARGAAMIVSFAVGAFLVFSWMALRRRGRKASADAA